MKIKMITILVMTMFLASTIAVATSASAKPSAVSVTYHQATFRWRALANPIGSWSSGTTQNVHTDFAYVLTGNVLHTSIGPLSTPKAGTDVYGSSTVYVYDSKAGVWVQNEGTVVYTSSQAPDFLTVTLYRRGYLSFDGAPSNSTFEHGVMYQWGYVYGVDETTVKRTYTNAVWDSTMGAWLIGFAIYMWDPTTITQSYSPPFPNPFIEPVPASNYLSP